MECAKRGGGKACMWVIISALGLATGSGLIVFFYAH
jgi:hypothetical protein